LIFGRSIGWYRSDDNSPLTKTGMRKKNGSGKN